MLAGFVIVQLKETNPENYKENVFKVSEVFNEIPHSSLVVVSPGKAIREVTEQEKKLVLENTKHYQDNWKRYSKPVF